MRRAGLLAPTLALAAALAPALAAQAPADGRVEGAVLDAATLRPLAGARVSLTPFAGSTGPAAGVTTDATGTYRFERLRPGRYQLRAWRVGYHPSATTLAVQPEASALVSLGLRVSPIALRPVRAGAPAPEPYGRHAAPAGQAAARAAADGLRRARALEADVVQLTHAEVEEAVSLGEADLFRALQRRPGVATRDDYSAELWTRGGRWDQTSVYFDGVLLFSPLHLGSALGALNPDAVGMAAFYPGGQPLELAGGAAGVLDVRTRPGGEGGRVRGAGELSAWAVRATADGALGGARGMLAVRHSRGDLVPVPDYGFRDVTARADLRLGGGATLEASVLAGSDRAGGTLDSLFRLHGARWATRAGQVTLDLPLRGGRLRQSVGASRFGAGAAEVPPSEVDTSSCGCGPLPPFAVSELESRAGYTYAGATWTRPRDAGGDALAAGYRLVREEARYVTATEWPYRHDGAGPARGAGGLVYGVLWGERRWSPLPEVEVEAGVRLEAGGRFRDAPGVRAAPRLAARWRPDERVGVWLSAGRRWQYTQVLVPTGAGLARLALANVFWQVAGDSVAPLRSDLLSAGVEVTPAGGWAVRAAGWRRASVDVLLPDPTPGVLSGRPLAVPGSARAWGAELALERIGPRWWGTAAYSYTRTELEAARRRYTAPTERRHVLAASAFARPVASVRAGAALTLASGGPFTRFVAAGSCWSGGCEPDWPLAGSPAPTRTRAYRSLDLLADWSGALLGVRVGAYLQLRNVLGQANPAAYRETRARCPANWKEQPCDWTDWENTSQITSEDRSLPGLPFLPLAGVRVSF